MVFGPVFKITKKKNENKRRLKRIDNETKRGVLYFTQKKTELQNYLLYFCLYTFT